jgi:thiol-disulfide isomerase/thioredoxin
LPSTKGCGHCKNLEPIYEELGKHVAGKVVIAKMDSTTNDNDHVAVKGFPTIVFFPAGSKVSLLLLLLVLLLFDLVHVLIRRTGQARHL